MGTQSAKARLLMLAAKKGRNEMAKKNDIPVEILDPVEDPVEHLTVRYTDNSTKETDPEQIAPDLAEPLELGEDGLPVGYKAGE